MGQTFQEDDFKILLLSLQPDLVFDLGSNLNMWHPYRDTRQSVFYQGRYLGAMDRGTLPETTFWSLATEMVEIPWDQVKPGEVAMYTTCRIIITCRKCNNKWEADHRPIGTIFCPHGCEHIAPSNDGDHWHFENKPTGMAMVLRKVRDRVILVGWRHTLRRIMEAKVPGFELETVEATFQVQVIAEGLDDQEIVESGEAKILDRSGDV